MRPSALAQVGVGKDNAGLGSGAVADELRAACSDPDPDVREEARSSLEWLLE